MKLLNQLMNSIHLASMGKPNTVNIRCNCPVEPQPYLTLKYVHMNIRFFRKLREESLQSIHYLYQKEDNRYWLNGAEVFLVNSESHPDFILNFE